MGRRRGRCPLAVEHECGRTSWQVGAGATAAAQKRVRLQCLPQGDAYLCCALSHLLLLAAGALTPRKKRCLSELPWCVKCMTPWQHKGTLLSSPTGQHANMCAQVTQRDIVANVVEGL